MRGSRAAAALTRPTPRKASRTRAAAGILQKAQIKATQQARSANFGRGKGLVARAMTSELAAEPSSEPTESSGPTGPKGPTQSHRGFVVLRGEDFFELPASFSIAQAVCSYGYFALAPNQWVPAAVGSPEDMGYLKRPFRYGPDRAGVVWVTIRQEQMHGPAAEGVADGAEGKGRPVLRVTLDREVGKESEREVMGGVARMLRVSLDLQEFHAMVPEAKERGFGRTFRSPCLWEDLVKTITNCNMKWSGTVTMNLRLCDKVGKEGSFPTPKEILAKSPEWLKENCRVGYRAERIYRLAQAVEGMDGVERLDLEWLEHPSRTQADAFSKLLSLYGFGNFAAHNACQLLGHFDSFPFDSETVRHFREKHGANGSHKFPQVAKMAEKHYSAFAPYQFLAYWFELWVGYEERRGSTSTRWAVRGDQKESTALFDVSTPKAPRAKRRRSAQANKSSSSSRRDDSKDDDDSDESRNVSRDSESTDSFLATSGAAHNNATPTKNTRCRGKKRRAREFKGDERDANKRR